MIIENELLIKIYNALVESKDIAHSEGYYDDAQSFDELIRSLKEEMSRELDIIIYDNVLGYAKIGARK